eukprot:m.479302 g.479302  ORF g.479302 m.479302 type:complete len:218 (+) comp21397_c0_seq1:174-827(+)
MERPFLYSLLVCLWAAFLVISLILILVGLLIEDGFVEGNDVELILNGVKTAPSDVQVGLFKQCINGDCFDIAPSDIPFSVWEAAAAFFIIGLIFLGFTIVAVLLCLCFAAMVPVSKIMHSLTNLWLMIAMVLVPIGFAWLDDECDSGSEKGQCGLVCYGDDDFTFFTLCGPYDIAEGLQVLIAGVFLLFLTSFLAVCIQVRQPVVEVKQVVTTSSSA